MTSWFENLTGFAETTYAEIQSKLTSEGDKLRSHSNGKSWTVGHLETPSLAELRSQVAPLLAANKGTLTVNNVVADAHGLHAQVEACNSLIQVASQFNLLEMTHYSVTPEDGVTRYQHDKTQGPACAIAAGPATIYRNYFVEVDGHLGQTNDRQINTLADLLMVLPGGLNVQMRNGYALVSDKTSLQTIHNALASASSAKRDEWRSLLRIGLHWNVEVTAKGSATGQLVSQAFCSALPVTYNSVGDSSEWELFARLVLEAAYEATLLAGVINAARNGSHQVFLTMLGGGAFGNERVWITDAIKRALDIIKDQALNVQIISYSGVPEDLRRLTADFVRTDH